MSPKIIAFILLYLPAMAQQSRHTYVTHKAEHAAGGILIAYSSAKLGYPKTGIALAWGAGLANELYEKKRFPTNKVRGGDVAWTGTPATVFSLSFKW